MIPKKTISDDPLVPEPGGDGETDVVQGGVRVALGALNGTVDNRDDEPEAIGKPVDLRTSPGGFGGGGGDGQLAVTSIEAGNSIVVQFFTALAIKIMVHVIQGYRRCKVTGCPACLGGLKVQEMFLLPLWNCLEGRIEVLRFPHSKGQRGLYSKITKILRAPEFDRHLYEITRTFDGPYDLEPSAASLEGDDVQESPAQLRAIKKFLEMSEAGKVDLPSLIAEVDRDELEERFPNFEQRIEYFTRTKRPKK